MNTIITRSALMPGGILYRPDRTVPGDLAYVVNDGPVGGHRVVTWADVLATRRGAQSRRLENIRRVTACRTYKVWVAYFDQFLMGGWQAFIEKGDDRNWIDRDRQWLMRPLMQLFPLVLTLGSERDQWQDWKVAFAEQFKRRTRDHHPLGVAYVWWDGSRDLRRPNFSPRRPPRE